LAQFDHGAHLHILVCSDSSKYSTLWYSYMWCWVVLWLQRL